MRQKSKLVVALDLDPDEFAEYTERKTTSIKYALYEIIFGSATYEQAAKSCNITKCAIYDHLKRMYLAKYGENDEQNKSGN